MENHRYAYEPNGPDDGAATSPHHCPAKDDERSGNQEGNGADATANECQQPGKTVPFNTVNEDGLIFLVNICRYRT